MITAALLGCDAPPEQCDRFLFLSNFHPTSGTEIVCRQIYSDVDSLTQFYTVYTDGKTTVTYWANSYPIRIEGEAPACLREEYRESIPRPPMLESECVRTPLAITP